MPRAQVDPALGVRVLGTRALRYDTAAAPDDDRPAHVRAASGLAFVSGRLAVIQDDAAFIGMVAGRRRDSGELEHGAGEVSALALPRGAAGRRRFEVGLGNKMEKLDLEACVAVGDELWAFGSGSAPAREKIAVIGYGTRMHDAEPLYRRIRDELESELNIEGVAIVGGELWLFHRGNTGAADPGPAVVTLDCAAFARWIASDGAVPTIAKVEHYDLGSAGDARLGFTDAVAVGGRVFYLAAAEGSPNAIDDGPVLAAQLGVIEGAGVRACELVVDGAALKAEGLAFDPERPRRGWLAIDPDDVDVPARLYEIELTGPW